MESSVAHKKERQYFIDWLRIVLIVSVFFYHIGMIFRVEQWHVNSEQSYSFLEPIMWWMSLWRMPLLFLVSGIGTYYALGYRTTWKYVKERIRRLYIPFAIGIFTLVPVQVYIEKIANYESLGHFYLHMFDGIYPSGNFSWHHLWFLVYLFLISMIVAPFIRFSRSDRFKRIQSYLFMKVSKPFGLNWVLIPLFLIAGPMQALFPGHSHALMDDWGYFVYYLIFFVSGFVLFTQKDLIRKVAEQRRLYLYQSIIFTGLLLLFWFTPISFPGDSMAYQFVRMAFTLSIGIAVLGYFRHYFNKENRFRKIFNEGIYPFYLLHQPIIIVIAFVILQYRYSDSVNVFLITTLSLLLICGLYWYVIRRFNLLRIIFGLKPIHRILNETRNIEESAPVCITPSLISTEKLRQDETNDV